MIAVRVMGPMKVVVVGAPTYLRGGARRARPTISPATVAFNIDGRRMAARNHRTSARRHGPAVHSDGLHGGYARQSKALVDQARKSGVKHIVHLGACGADDTDVVHYGWHQFVERYIDRLCF
jgi:hypothetical protein